ncbi:hypothetical protein [Ciceribacter ferrooxidans]|uniref:Uncharacterized protein n=1 Tax=Ciceribacter ferrooxidans TaxID=2509717 RepID=A0A4Q2T4T5_9HYPH|nr:hypothetical protein [Ciceribacter ferrooxidans]RYC11878.1 hypothetical protein EUU22_12470 [Ciceribacter ferrooxidans]
MTGEQEAFSGRLIRLIKIAWALSIMTIATATGVYVGWETHGLAGAVALGFVGVVVGGFLSAPSLLLQMIS